MNRRSIRFTYLLACFFTLIAVANHFNFVSVTASDILATEHSVNNLASITSTPPAHAIIATHYATLPKTTTPPTPAYRTYILPPAIDLASDAGVIDIISPSDPGIYHYRSLYYGHAAYQFGIIKTYNIGDRIKAGDTTYRITATKIYPLADFQNPSLRSSIYNYQGITLMTCGSTDNIDNNYRTIIFAEKL